VETELGEGFLFVHIQLSEDLGRVQKMRVVNNLLDVVSEERQVEDKRKPVSIDQKQKRQESVDGDFGDDVRVETVAEVDGVDVVATSTNVLASQCMSRAERRQRCRGAAECPRIVAGHRAHHHL
jgi:hypothetical protein